MEFTINTENKTISFDQSINVSELVKELKEMRPKDWKEYDLISITSAINIPYYPYIPNAPIVTY